MSKPILEVDGKRYEVVEIRPPGFGEAFLNIFIQVEVCSTSDSSDDRPILKEIRWRAEELEEYFYLNDRGHAMSDKDVDCDADNERYKCGNYFRTEEEMKESAIYKSYIRD